MRRDRIVLMGGILLLQGIAGTPPACAHPVAQGALDVEIEPGKVHVRARVSTEEAFVATAFAPQGDEASSKADGEESPPQGVSGGAVSSGQVLAKVWKSHGHYLLRHLRVLADGGELAGRLVGFTGPGKQSSAGDRILYDLEYDVPPRTAGREGPARSAGQSGPSELRIEQDVLNEIEFALGNRWEATYVVRIGQRGRAPVEGLLLTSREPVIYACDWTSGAGSAGSRAQGLDRWRLARDYTRHGIAHILTGYDHLLFICALVLATVTLWDLVKIISAFTLAHTLTLTLAVLDIVRLPGRIVEPMIAASIVFVALQNVFWPGRTRGAGRMLVAFFFGLFHGLGFAGGLLSAMEGMAGATVALAIVAFSAGVELGHQMVVLPIFGALRLASMRRSDAREVGRGRDEVHARALKYGSVLISGAGLFYLIAALR